MDFDEAIALPEGPERTAAVTAWVQAQFHEEERAPVLVGGAAVEILTGGAYTTGDFDFVGHVPASVQRILKNSGFVKAGRHWIHEEAEIFLEFPGVALGPEEKATRLKAYGFDLVLVSIEDLLVDRLGSWAYWKSGVDGANAFLLLRTCRNKIDNERLRQRSRETGFEPPLEALLAFDREWATAEPNPTTLEQWANAGPRDPNP